MSQSLAILFVSVYFSSFTAFSLNLISVDFNIDFDVVETGVISMLKRKRAVT
jgi:hypothetical protein|nr:MAG TPA_asm: hypothetical protein [Caudoviricetes sp.]